MDVSGFRDPRIIESLKKSFEGISLTREVTLMEVCGTHTMAIRRSGIPALIPRNIRLLSGPGCPVCVTPAGYLDTAIKLGEDHNTVLTTFGDMMRVPGGRGTLTGLRSEGGRVQTVYSPLAALEMAKNDPSSEYVFLAVGFETTIPAVAATLLQAQKESINNFSLLVSHKLVIPALKILAGDTELAVDGFILPGHVSAILGCVPYEFIARDYHRACVVTGFEPVDILQGITMLLKQIRDENYSVEIQYDRVVKREGNKKAAGLIFEVFEPADEVWRGFGNIPQSGLRLKREFGEFDALNRFPLKIEHVPEPAGCLCGAILQGKNLPEECPLFARVCTPENPVGPCMVSSEGTCAAYYKYSQV